MLTSSLVGTVLIACIVSAMASPIEVKFDQTSREYKNSGTFILHEPVTDKVLGKYRFITGGCGRGSAPFGKYIIGPFRGTDDDPHHIGERWMIHHPGRDNGEAWDPKIEDVRVDLELHALHVGHVKCTFGCIGIDGGPDVWKDFENKLRFLIAWNGIVTFDFWIERSSDNS